MKELRYTLISDGSSDRAFLPILKWLLIDLGIDYAIRDKWADFTRLPNPPKSLQEKISVALDLYPCHLLFIHRDAEKESRQKRLDEIQEALRLANISDFPVVSVIPIRMLEAWLLFDKSAIRQAAGNPNGKCEVRLPTLKKVEDLPDPKSELLNILKDASELNGRRLKNFRERQAVQNIARNIKDFSLLNNLSAFQALKEDLAETIKNQGWDAAS
jgi:hypothetical protein